MSATDAAIAILTGLSLAAAGWFLFSLLRSFKRHP